MSKGEITLRLKGISLLIPQEYCKSGYATFLKFIHKYALQIKTATLRRNVFFYHGEDIQIDLEFPFGEKLTGISHHKISEKILENAHLLTKIAVRYFLNDYYLKGKDLLHATKKAIEEDIEFLKTGKSPEYINLRIYVGTYDDEIVKLLINKTPPIVDCNIDQCIKYYEINDKYLNFTKESETLRSFESLLDIKRHLQNASNSKNFRIYLYLYKTILMAMGIEEDYSEDLLFTIKFFFV